MRSGKYFHGQKIGGTPLYQDDALRARLGKASKDGTPVVWIKDESCNPTHIHKDRVAVAEIERLLESGHENVTFVGITDGGLAESIGYFARLCRLDIRFASVVDSYTQNSTLERLQKYGPVIKLDLENRRLNSSELVELVRKEINDNSVIIPIGGINAWSGYIDIADELYFQGINNTYRIFIPVGGGDTVVNIIKGFEDSGSIPKFVGATIPGNLFSDVPCDGYGFETRLRTKFSGVKHDLEELAKKYDIKMTTVTREERQETMKFLSEAGIPSGATASVAFAAAERYARETGFENDENVVILNTGYEEGYKLQNKLKYEILSQNRSNRSNNKLTNYLFGCLVSLMSFSTLSDVGHIDYSAKTAYTDSIAKKMISDFKVKYNVWIDDLEKCDVRLNDINNDAMFEYGVDLHAVKCPQDNYWIERPTLPADALLAELVSAKTKRK